MSHVRQQIRDAVASALMGLTTTQNRVFPSRVYPMTAATLPGLTVFTQNETIEPHAMGRPIKLKHEMEIVIEAYVKQTADFDNAVDTISGEIETAVAQNSALQSLVKLILPVDLAIETFKEGDQPVAVATMTYRALFFTHEGTPETIVN